MIDGSDEELMARAGEMAALGRLAERHHGPLLGYLYRLTGGDRPLAEDLLQESFVRVLQQRSYQAGRPFKPWLYAIATNLARDHFKAAAVRTRAPTGEAPERIDDQPSPEAHALRSEQGGEVAAALARLPAEYRAALLLRFYGDMSLREIAATLDVPVGTVKSRLSVGCRRLRDLLSSVYERVEP